MLCACSRESATDRGWELVYSKPTGPFANAEFKRVPDPAPNKEVNEYLAEVASGCRLGEWSIVYMHTTDVNDTATLSAPTLDQEQLACIRKSLHPPYLTLRQVRA